jgi:hypothetical protein
MHPSILLDEGNLSAIRDSCPGINKKLSYNDFCRQLSALLAEQKK